MYTCIYSTVCTFICLFVCKFVYIYGSRVKLTKYVCMYVLQDLLRSKHYMYVCTVYYTVYIPHLSINM